MEIYKVIIDNNGVVRWFDQRGNLHREGGFPAVEFPDGSKRYYEHGKRHRIDGPAVLNSDGTNQWWIDDKQLSEEKFDDRNKKGMKPFNKYYEEVGLNNIKLITLRQELETIYASFNPLLHTHGFQCSIIPKNIIGDTEPKFCS
jgi:hypothetical protein